MPSILSIPRNTMRKRDGNALLRIERATGESSTFVCQFNPDQYHINVKGKLNKIERQGEDSPIVQFMGGSSSVLDLKLFFDTSTSYEIKTGMGFRKPKKEKAQDVSVYTETLMSLVRIEGKACRPPLVTFSWGSLLFSGLVENVDVNYTMFEKGGIPVRAEVSLNIVSAKLKPLDTVKLKAKEPSAGTKCVTMTSDSSLWDIAEKEYGDASHWKDIAEENNILNPLEVSAGTQLKVPALPEVR
ncbi:hypothetical protein D7V86_01545 [bacterium D16-51]|nr:hypothetical protein D7V96_00975 [bacterium D16-59]RKI62484.1 hypothetical protein D7V86_01545 [bacterium D16-51]